MALDVGNQTNSDKTKIQVYRVSETSIWLEGHMYGYRASAGWGIS